MPDTGPAAVIAKVQEIIDRHASVFDSVETISVSPEAEMVEGKRDWRQPVIQVKARQPDELAGVPAQLDDVPVRIVAATIMEQADHFKSVVLGGVLPPGQARAWRVAGTAEAAPDYAALTYRPLQPSRLLPVDAPMALTLHASPDAGWSTLHHFLQPAGSWKIAMYDFTAPHIITALRAAVEASGGTLDLCLGPGESLPAAGTGGTKADDVSEKKTVEAYLAAFGDKFNFAWASVGLRRQWPRAYHIKVAVRDGNAFWLSSGNWQSSNQPDFEVVAVDGKPGAQTARDMAAHNREWHVIAEDEALAKSFEDYIDKDIATSQADGAGAESPTSTDPGTIPVRPMGEYPPDHEFTLEFRLPDSPFDAIPEAPRLPRTVFELLILPKQLDRPRKVQPILTPDNYGEFVLPLISGAQERLWFQNQSLNINKNPSENYRKLLDALKAKSWELKDFRIIFRDFYRTDTKDALRLLALDGFNMAKIRVMQNCHTKGILVDSRRALIGSHNWTNEGTTYNRDASLLFDDAEVTAYYEPIMDHDWRYLAYPLDVDVGTPAAVIDLPGEAHVPGLRARLNPRPNPLAD